MTLKEKNTVGECKLGKYTIKYAANNMKLFEIKDGKDMGIMFLSLDHEYIYGIIMEVEGKIKITNVTANGVVEIEDNIITIFFHEYDEDDE